MSNMTSENMINKSIIDPDVDSVATIISNIRTHTKSFIQSEIDIKITQNTSTLLFTLTGVDVSYANAIRRTILSDIPIVVFKTTPYELNNCNIITNTTRFTNEIIKQRLSCIPIHISNISEFKLNQMKKYLLIVDVQNNTDNIMYVTTEHFKIRILDESSNNDTSSIEYLDTTTLREIFPPYIAPTNGNATEYFIDFLRLRPQLATEIPGESIKLTCKFTIGTAREDSMFNVVGTCSYGFTQDTNTVKTELEKLQHIWKNEGKDNDTITFETQNWLLLGAYRYFIKNSYDFIIETIGIFDNDVIFKKSCEILIDRLTYILMTVHNGEIQITHSDNILPCSYDIKLINEDYTIGNMLHYELYEHFYKPLENTTNNTKPNETEYELEQGAESKSNLDQTQNQILLNYVGFKKYHPHDTDSIIRVSFINETNTIESVKQLLIYIIPICITKLEVIYNKMEQKIQRK